MVRVRMSGTLVLQTHLNHLLVQLGPPQPVRGMLPQRRTNSAGCARPATRKRSTPTPHCGP